MKQHHFGQKNPAEFVIIRNLNLEAYVKVKTDPKRMLLFEMAHTHLKSNIRFGSVFT